MTQRKVPVGFTILDAAGGPVGTYRADTETLDDAAALRAYMQEKLPEGGYWLITVREDQCYLQQMEVNDERTTVAPPYVHRYRYPRSYRLSADTRAATRALQIALLRSERVPAGVIDRYMLCVGN
jgi:hypothetical protein